jgi:hypothetical protein
LKRTKLISRSFLPCIRSGLQPRNDHIATTREFFGRQPITSKKKLMIKTFKTQPNMAVQGQILITVFLATLALFLRHDSQAGQSAVQLGSATKFAVLAATTVTSTGTTLVNGNLGASPGTDVAGTLKVSGMIHAGGQTAGKAQADLKSAYNDTAGRTTGALNVEGNLGGLRLTPGLYKSTSSLEISSGDLVLDALGDTNAVFIFQTASKFTTTAGRQVILSGGARSANVYWQVGGSGTLGKDSAFKGNLLAWSSIVVMAGANVEGRLLSRNGAITMDTSSITQPAP